MTEIAEGIAVPGVSSTEEDKTLVNCDWTKCLENHAKEPNYSNGGTVERNGSYEKDWVNANLEPWQLYGDGNDSKAALPDYREETPAAKYAVNAADLKHPEYHTQKHHLISVNLFDGVKKLGKNAKLVGYDVNHKNNGVCLPSYILDIVQHDLQCHRGSHPKVLYNDKIKPLLANLEKRCLKYCEMDYDGDAERQSDLLGELNRLSGRIHGKIKAWFWLLRKNALLEREQSKERYKSID